jgi:hypothetical protein
MVTGSRAKSLELVAAGKGLLFAMDDDDVAYMARNYCDIVKMVTPVSVLPTHLIFRKGSQIIPIVDEAIQHHRLKILQIYRKYIDYMDRLKPTNCGDDDQFRINKHGRLFSLN